MTPSGLLGVLLGHRKKMLKAIAALSHAAAPGAAQGPVKRNSAMVRRVRYLLSCVTAATCTCRIREIEETIKFVHLTWGVGERAVLGGGSAHKERAAVPVQVLTDSEASAAASDVLGNSYPHDLVVNENPLEAKAARVELALGEIALKGLKDDLRRTSEQMKRGQAPGRMKNLADFREKATYASPKKGKWVSPEEEISRNLAKALVNDARSVASLLGQI